MSHFYRHRGAVLVCALAFAASLPAAVPQADTLRHPDHYEFSATLDAAFTVDANGAVPIRLNFDYPAAGASTVVAWTVEVVGADQSVLRRWIGESRLADGHGRRLLSWDGRDGRGIEVGAGFYSVRLHAVPAVHLDSEQRSALHERVALSFRLAASERIDQTMDVQIGQPPTPIMPQFQALPHGVASATRGKGAPRVESIAAAGSLPYTIYFGNLHSQTNHSDGGGTLSSCTGAQAPQSGAFGPADAYAMMDVQAGGDFLLASEHNHMYDGSTGTNANAVPATASALFQSGRKAAADYSLGHPAFLALYGLEWGVISNGGHLNIVNADALAEWEFNGSGQLIGDVNTPKSDYAALYTTMQQRGWVGQFNHPATTGQFLINAVPLGFDAAGDQVMALAEVMNTSAFSVNTTETETSRSNYIDAFNILLERGYHVAPTTDQDNHCANWGLSFRNRTGVLLPNASALNTANFVDALRARRVFATEDKTAQLVLTANGALMGQTIANSGALALDANYASSSGQSAARVQFFEGVPGRNGAVTQLFEGAGTYTFTPAAGSHFYYALVTEGDGDRLWSAPIWVNQGAGGGDTTAPTASASETGSSGTITLAATASDNVGVTNVEFYVDGVLKGADATSPYSLSLDSTTLSNASHSLTAKAYDAAGNVGTSTAVSFSINNVVADTTPPTATASETGSSGAITLAATASDNVGVTKVEFYVDSVLKGTDTTSPYSLSLDSTTLSNASHNLTAKAYDAAGNIGTSAAVSFAVSNAVATQFNETESNGSVAAANAVAHTFKTIVGTMGNTTDKDYFALPLAAGETLKIDMVGPSSTDYDLSVVNASDTALVSSTGSTSTESVTYTNGSAAQTVYAKVIAFSGSSTTLTYTLTVTYTAATPSSELIGNGGFEAGNTVWTASASVIDSSTTQAAHTGSWKAWLDGYGAAHTDSVLQTVSIPAAAPSATLTFWLKVVSSETTTTTAYDTLKLQVRNGSGSVLATLKTYSNLDKGSSYVLRSFDLSAYKGQTVQIYFVGVEDASSSTSFLIDDVSLK